MKEFFIISINYKWKNWNSIVNLKGKTKDWIIHQYHVLQIPVRYYSQIFHITKFCLYTMMPV